MGNHLLFPGVDGLPYDLVPGLAIWKSDGTAEGTGIGAADALEGVYDLSWWSWGVGDSYVIFHTEHEGTWRSDGTEEGTFWLANVKSCWPGTGGYHNQYARLGREVFFCGWGWDSGPDYDFELWKTDGTVAGTRLVKDIAYNLAFPRDLTRANGTLYFTADEETSGRELWKSDGTEAGTQLVKDIEPGPGPSEPHSLTELGGSLYFLTLGGPEGLWKSDGTESGTVLVRAASGSFELPDELTTVGSQLFFLARDPVRGQELWKSDGTGRGTVLFTDSLDGAVTMLLPRYCAARFDLCAGPPEIHLKDETISDERSVTACNRLLLGPGLRLTATADVTLEAGEFVVFMPDVVIEAGARLRVTTRSP